mmetsp:Transcript_28474/g.40805  ORF Transcript_28474/g.40805 Transcript_28474/m.40805 type:complete len:215 (+) Transcript_28474:205-849(+)|eukprot:CAMPEP_0172431360 /NCGR_PEP_ID=MMETSP1064-20121228/58275_1 /TAXON_ID=202472 /ORGANISM="Aulacoseira subarctica , Strain CCAP 1002/5" /LENGTH=214 /DNA_ID=CAMNT_0013178013 /DNA_START=234 /DNA_END=878 /DNA_ORIENTATION=-
MDEARNQHIARNFVESGTKDAFPQNPYLGRYRSYYNKRYCQNTLIIFGLGTAIEIEDYFDLAKNVAFESPIIFVILDPTPDNPVKYIQKAAFAKNVEALIDANHFNFRGHTWKKVVIGGPSASGRAAIESFPLLTRTPPDAFFGSDPFDTLMTIGNIPCPALLWGFKNTTCWADVNMAAMSACNFSINNRILFQIQNDDKTELRTVSSPTMDVN